MVLSVVLVILILTMLLVMLIPLLVLLKCSTVEIILKIINRVLVPCPLTKNYHLIKLIVIKLLLYGRMKVENKEHFIYKQMVKRTGNIYSKICTIKNIAKVDNKAGDVRKWKKEELDEYIERNKK